MRFFWTDEAERQYLKYANDPDVQRTFRDLITMVNLNPNAGWSVSELVSGMTDPVAVRIANAIRDMPLPGPARIVVATVPRPQRAAPPPWLAAVIHINGAPSGIHAEHTLLTMATVSRKPNAPMR